MSRPTLRLTRKDPWKREPASTPPPVSTGAPDVNFPSLTGLAQSLPQVPFTIGQPPSGGQQAHTAIQRSTPNNQETSANSQQTAPQPPPLAVQDPATRTRAHVRIAGTRDQFWAQCKDWNGNYIAKLARFPYLEKVDTQWDDRPTYIKPDWSRDTFEKGDIINRPYHVPNKDSDMHNTDPMVKETEQWSPFVCWNPYTGQEEMLKTFVYSKKRMFVVLYKHGRTMFCLPLYSYHQDGFKAIPRNHWEEHVAVRDSMHRGRFTHRGHWPAIDAVHCSKNVEDAFHMNSTIDLASGTSMRWDEEALWPVGRLTKQGYDRLEAIWRTLMNRASHEVSNFPTVGAFAEYNSPPHSGVQRAPAPPRGGGAFQMNRGGAQVGTGDPRDVGTITGLGNPQSFGGNTGYGNPRGRGGASGSGMPQRGGNGSGPVNPRGYQDQGYQAPQDFGGRYGGQGRGENDFRGRYGARGRGQNRGNRGDQR